MNQVAASNTAVRLATAGALIPLVVAAVWWGPAWLVALLVGGVILASLLEFFSLGQRQGLPAYRHWTLLCAAFLVFCQFTQVGVEAIALAGRLQVIRGNPAVPPELALLLFVGGAIAGTAFGRRSVSQILPGLGISAAGLLVVALPASYLVRLHGLPRDGRTILLFTLSLVWAGDAAAYAVGRTLGRRKLAPQLSPQKTWEGSIANLAASLLVALVFSQWLPFGVGHLLAVAGIANVAGQLGDLAESAFKRGAGVKDSGALLPGHGGMLDRIDALVFACPVVWAYLTWIA